jgi:hypothetical protein
MNRKKKCYVCSKASNYGTCEFKPIEEDFLKELITRRYQKEMSDEEIREVTEMVMVNDKWDIEIYFTDGSDPILIKGKFMQF